MALVLPVPPLCQALSPSGAPSVLIIIVISAHFFHHTEEKHRLRPSFDEISCHSSFNLRTSAFEEQAGILSAHSVTYFNDCSFSSLPFRPKSPYPCYLSSKTSPSKNSNCPFSNLLYCHIGMSQNWPCILFVNTALFYEPPACHLHFCLEPSWADVLKKQSTLNSRSFSWS